MMHQKKYKILRKLFAHEINELEVLGYHKSQILQIIMEKIPGANLNHICPNHVEKIREQLKRQIEFAKQSLKINNFTE